MHLPQYLCTHFVTRHSISIVSIHIEHCSVSPSWINSFVRELRKLVPNDIKSDYID